MIVGKAPVLQKSGLTALFGPIRGGLRPKAPPPHLARQPLPIRTGVKRRLDQRRAQPQLRQFMSYACRPLATTGAISDEVSGKARVIEHTARHQRPDERRHHSLIEAALRQPPGQLSAAEIAARQERYRRQLGPRRLSGSAAIGIATVVGYVLRARPSASATQSLGRTAAFKRSFPGAQHEVWRAAIWRESAPRSPGPDLCAP